MLMIVWCRIEEPTLSNPNIDSQVDRSGHHRLGEDQDILQANYHHKVGEDLTAENTDIKAC